MAFGYQIYSPTGQLLMDTDTSTGLIIGFVLLNAGTQSGSVTNADLLKGTPFHILMPPNGSIVSTPGVSFSGDTMTWTPPPSGSFLGRIWYGVR